MDTKDIKYIQQVLQEGSVTKAAEKLHITPQALSKIIRKIEDEIGIELFERTYFGMTPTKKGQLFFEKSEELLDHFRILEDMFKSDIESKNAQISVTAALGIIALLTPEVIFEFNRRFPNCKIHISENTDYKVDSLVREKQVDVGLAVSPVDNHLFHEIPLLNIPHCLLVNKNHPLASKEMIEIKDLKNEKITLESREFKVYQKFYELCRAEGFEPDIYFETTEIHFAHELASRNKCVSISVMSETRGKEYENILVKPFKEEFYWEICLITKKHERIGEIQQVFIQHIMEAIGSKKS